MAGSIKGITLEIGGDTQPLNKALADVSKKSKDLQSELKQVERLLKLDPKNTELVAQKQKILADAVSNSKEKLERLKKAQAEVNEQFRRGEISGEQYRAFQREIVKTEQSLESLKNKSKEFGSVFTRQMELAGAKMREVGDKVTDVGKNMSMKVTAPIVAAGAVAFKMAADTQDAMGATDQVFKGAAESMKSWAASLETYYGIAKGEALEYGNMMGSMLQNIGGLTEDEAAKQSQTLIKLAGDLTAMYGGTTQDAVRALTGALKGNNTMLDNYGMAANDAMVKTKALEMGLYDGKGAMDLATKQAATLALIMEQSAAAQGQAAREADGASGSMRAFMTETKNLSNSLGEVLLPIITPLLSSLSGLIKAFSNLSPAAQKTIVAVAAIAAAIGPVLIVTGKVISSVGVIMGSFGKLAAFLPSLGTVFTALTGPIGIIIAIVAALAAGVYLVIKNWDKISAFFSNLWEAVKNIFSSAWEAITNFLSGALQGIISLFRQYTPVGIVISQWDEIKNAISSKINAAKDAVRNALDAIYSFFANLSLPEIKIPHIKLPHFSIQGEFDLRNFKVPSLGVDWYDQGGIFRNPAIIGVGERRPEFVGALDDLRDIFRSEISRAVQPKEVNIEVNNYGTKGESAEGATTRELQKLQILGVFG